MTNTSGVHYKEDQEDFSWDSTDFKLQLAEQTGDSHLLLKEELRLKIQLKRLKEGKPEMEISFEEPRQYELSEEEKKKQEKRKERNRLAAKNSRTKRRKHQEQVENRHKELNSENKSLRLQVDKLRKAAKKLMDAALESRRCNMLSLQPLPLRQSSVINGADAQLFILGGLERVPLAHDDLLGLCSIDLSQSLRELHELKASAPRPALQKPAIQKEAAWNRGSILPQIRSEQARLSSFVEVPSAVSSSSSSSFYGVTQPTGRFNPYAVSRCCRPASGKSLPSSTDSSPRQSPSPGSASDPLQILLDIELNNMQRDAQPGI